jgi:hypothetical protein
VKLDALDTLAGEGAAARRARALDSCVVPLIVMRAMVYGFVCAPSDFHANYGMDSYVAPYVYRFWFTIDV